MPQAFQSYKPRHMKVFGAICVNNLGNVLLVRGKRSKKWSFPKGHCKGNETDIECALRELKEETGLILTNKYSSYHKLRGAGYFIFPIEGTPETTINDNWEIEEISWCPIKNLPQLDSNVDVSIFRTLMKTMRSDSDDSEDILEFIESTETYKKINSIKNSIQNSADLIPINIPRCS